jgi:hypothetical protein
LSIDLGSLGVVTADTHPCAGSRNRLFGLTPITARLQLAGMAISTGGGRMTT